MTKQKRQETTKEQPEEVSRYRVVDVMGGGRYSTSSGRNDVQAVEEELEPELNVRQMASLNSKTVLAMVSFMKQSAQLNVFK